MGFDIHVLENNYLLLLSGLGVTLYIATVSLAIGIVLGALACLGKLSESGLSYRLANAFIDFFRTVPEVVIIFWVYSCLPLLLDLRISPQICGIISLSVFAGAFLAEIFRAGVLAVPRGQVEAAHALGLPIYYVWRHAIVPPAVRRMVPAFVNFLTEMLKITSLLMAIGIGELMYRANTLGAETYRFMELYTAAGIMYFAVIFPLSVYARRAERRRVQRTGN